MLRGKQKQILTQKILVQGMKNIAMHILTLRKNAPNKRMQPVKKELGFDLPGFIRFPAFYYCR